MKNIFDFIKGKDSDDADFIKRKQYMILAVTVLGLGSIFWFLKSGVKKVATSTEKTEKLKKVVVGDLIDEKETWISRVEEESSKMAAIVNVFKEQNLLQEKRISTLEEALMAQVKNKDATLKIKKPIPQKTLTNKGFNPSQGDMFSQDLETVKNTFPSSSNGFGNQGASLEPIKKILHYSIGGQGAFHHARDYVVAGSHARVVLTSGAVVSTAISSQGNPQPIVMRLADQGNLPRGWKSHLKDAVIIGSCYGDLSSERALCRIHTLSFIEPSGRTVEKSVEGWVIGEDGAPGLRGKVVDRAGKVAREAFIAGMLSGMSDFFKSSTQSSVFPVSPFGQSNALKTDDVFKSGAAQGASNALGKLAEFSIKRAEAMQPVLVVNPGRVVDVVFKKGFDLNPLSLNGASNGLRPIQASSQDIGGKSFG